MGLKCCHKCLYKREGDLTQKIEKKAMGADNGVMWPQAKECQKLPDAGKYKEQISIYTLWEKLLDLGPVLTLDVGHQNREKIKFFFKCYQVCGNLL